MLRHLVIVRVQFLILAPFLSRVIRLTITYQKKKKVIRLTRIHSVNHVSSYEDCFNTTIERSMRSISECEIQKTIMKCRTA